MKILLLSPPYPKDKIFRKSMKHLGAVLPPLGLAYIAAMLEKEGHEIKIVDGPAWATVSEYGYEELEKDLLDFNPELIGISASSSQLDHVKNCLNIINKTVPNAKTILGGTMVSSYPEILIEDLKEINYGVYGEADLTFSDIVNKIEKNESLENTEGVIWRENGNIKFLKPKMITDLDQVPMPARHLLKMEIYRPSPANFRRVPATTLISSRGCPYQCIFCSRPTEGTAFRAHSAKRVVDEIEYLINNYGIKDIQFFDDTFTLIPKRVEDICKDIIERNLDIGWNCMTRLDKINPDLLSLMKKAGCYEIGVGIESGNDRVLTFIKKSLTTDMVRKGVKMIKKVGIDVRGFFMIGFPTETRNEILDTIEFAKDIDVDVAQFMVATPFPGTELWKIAQENGTVSNDWNSFTFYAPDKIPFSSELLNEKELVSLYKKAYKSFYLRPKFILRQAAKIRSYMDVQRNWQAAKGVIGF